MSLVIVFNILPEVIARMHSEAGKIVAEVAEDWRQQYADTAAVDTGFMRSSAYTRTHDQSGYGNTDGSRPLNEEVDQPENDQTAYVAVAATYAPFLEYGTRFISAQPAFLPAGDLAKVNFGAKLAGLEKRVGGL
jgi:hypothetical protein